MFFLLAIVALLWASISPSVTAAAVGDFDLQTRNGDAGAVEAVARALRAAKLERRDHTYTMNETSLAKSWSGATLFSIGTSGSHSFGQNETGGTVDAEASIAIVCATCYINGTARGSFTIGDDFNITQTIDNVKEEVINVTRAAIDTLEDYAEEVAEDIATFQLSDIPAWPTLDVDLDLENLVAVPSVHGRFEFDALELYLELELRMAAQATYTYELFASKTEFGFKVEDLEVGAVFSVSLILMSEAEIDITGGIHIKLDDGLALDLELFNKNASGITLPGAQFEFLPVTIAGHGSIEALLQLEIQVGFEASTPQGTLLSASTGIEADAFAYVADFLIEVDGSSTDDCELAAVAEYTMAVGAAAGATIAIDTYQWGPAPSTTTPLWYTTLASICAVSKTDASVPATPAVAAAADVTPRAVLQPRETMVTTTVSTTESYTIVNCLSAGLINCPPALQNTTSVKHTYTSVLTIPSGASATYPASTYASVTSAIPFGTNVLSIDPTSGKPKSYTPPPKTTSHSSTTTGGASSTNTSSSSDSGGGSGGLSQRDKLIIGLTVGLGVPFLAVVIAGLWFLFRRKKYTPVPQPDMMMNNGGFAKSSTENKKTPTSATYAAS